MQNSFTNLDLKGKLKNIPHSNVWIQPPWNFSGQNFTSITACCSPSWAHVKSNVQQNYGYIRRVKTTKRRKRRTWYGNLRFLLRPPGCDVRWLSNLITIPNCFRSKGTRFSSGTSQATGSVRKGCIRKLVQILMAVDLKNPHSNPWDWIWIRMRQDIREFLWLNCPPCRRHLIQVSYKIIQFWTVRFFFVANPGKLRWES